MPANPLVEVKQGFSSLEKDIVVDVAIVGAGITGISSAYHLANAGYEVAVLEEQGVGEGATGASSGVLSCGTGTDFTTAVQLFGKQNSTMLWKESQDSIRQIVEIIGKNGIDCGLRNPGAIMVAQNEEEKSFLQEEQLNLQSMGFDSKLLDAREVAQYFASRQFSAGGLKQGHVYQIYPALFAAGLATEAGNLAVYSNSPYLSHTVNSSSIIVQTPKAKVECKKILFATNLKPCFGLEKYFSIENSSILASTRLSKEKMETIWPKETIIWTVEEKYDLIYPHDSRLVLEVYDFKQAKEKTSFYYPEFQQEHFWGDSWSKTSDWLPIIGQAAENQYVAVAMGDQGIVMGWTAGKKMSALIEGKQDEFLSLVSPRRFGKP